MRLSDIAETTIHQVVGRLVRRALGFVVLALLAVIAIYYASAAGTVALSIQFGLLNAYLIMAAGYAVAVLIVVGVLYATRARPVAPPARAAGALASPRNMQIAMLIEAVMLGYSMARKSGDKIG